MVAQLELLGPVLNTSTLTLWQKVAAHSFVVRLREAIEVARQLLSASQQMSVAATLVGATRDLVITGIIRALAKLSELWQYLQAYKRAAEAQQDTELIARLYDLVYTLRFVLNWSRMGTVLTRNEISPQAATQAALQVLEPFVIHR